MRFELLENGNRTVFVYHNGELLHEEGGKEKQTGCHLGAGIDAFRRGQDTYYYHQDEQLSTALITGGNGFAENSYQYDAFGAEAEAGFGEDDGGNEGGAEPKGESKSVKPESAVTRSKKHGVNWKEGPARAKATGNPQGQWAQSDLDYATKMANTLKPGESGYFDLPEGSQSIVHMPDGTTQPATRMWIRNNGTGTWHGYPMQ